MVYVTCFWLGLTRYMCYIGQQLGSEPSLPYLSPELTGERLLVGANFASAGIGILNDTGIQFVSPPLYIYIYIY